VVDRARALVRSLLGHARLDRDIEDELRFHMEEYAADLMRGGMPADQAHFRARREFGNFARAKEECRSMTPASWFDESKRNVRYSIRQLRQAPAFTATAVLTLGLCIGVNTGVFSILDAVLLRPVPFPEPDRLADIVREFRRAHTGDVMRIAGQDGAAWDALKNAKSFRAAVSGSTGGVNLSLAGRAVYVERQRVGSGYFSVLGMPPALGREFNAEEDRVGGPPVAILSHAIWTNLFQADPSVVGRRVLLRGEQYEVIGVAAAVFRPRGKVDIWTPLRATTTGEGAGINYDIVARLKDGVSWAQADAETQALGAAAFAGKNMPSDVVSRLTLSPFERDYSAGLRQRLVILSAAVALVLLIGCVNIASLLLARGASRRREMGTRVALGGGPGALVRQLASESLLLGALGGVAGLAFAYLAIWSLQTVLLRYGIWQEVRLDARALAATALLSLLVSVVFGLAPALQASRVDVREALLEGGTRSVAGSRSGWFRQTLVLAEISLSVVLVVGAARLVRTVVHLQSLSPGFDAANVLCASASLDDARYREADAVNRLFDRTLEAIRRAPGVESAAVGLHVPYQRWLNNGVRVRGSAFATGGFVGTSMNYITPGYFETLRIALRAGRDFRDADTSTSESVAIVNEDFVRQLLKGEDALHCSIVSGTEIRRIVGVVANVQQQPGLTRSGPLKPEPALYIPAAQFSSQGFRMAHTWFAPNWIIRTRVSRASAGAAIERAIAGVDPMLPVNEVQTMIDERNGSLQTQRVNAGLLGSVAALAVILALVGIYGLVTHLVANRTHEFGIRMALGSSTMGTLWTAVRQGVLLSVSGAVIGACIAGVGVRILKSLLYGVKPVDAASFTAGMVGIVVVGAAASLIPALRLVRLDIASVLRHE